MVATRAVAAIADTTLTAELLILEIPLTIHMMELRMSKNNPVGRDSSVVIFNFFCVFNLKVSSLLKICVLSYLKHKEQDN